MDIFAPNVVTHVANKHTVQIHSVDAINGSRLPLSLYSEHGIVHCYNPNTDQRTTMDPMELLERLRGFADMYERTPKESARKLNIPLERYLRELDDAYTFVYTAAMEQREEIKKALWVSTLTK